MQVHVRFPAKERPEILSDVRKRVWAEMVPLSIEKPQGRPANGLLEVLAKTEKEGLEVNRIVEIGGELGGSTRLFGANFPSAQVVTVDPWPEEYSRYLPEEFVEARKLSGPFRGSLWQVFLNYCSAFADKLIPLRASSHDALPFLAEVGFRPSLVYVDGEHRHHSAYADLVLTSSLFPNAWIVGDDWNFNPESSYYRGVAYPVRQAANDFSIVSGRELHSVANTYYLPPRGV